MSESVVRQRLAFLGSVGCELFEYITRRTSKGEVLGLFTSAFAFRQGRNSVHSLAVALLPTITHLRETRFRKHTSILVNTKG